MSDMSVCSVCNVFMFSKTVWILNYTVWLIQLWNFYNKLKHTEQTHYHILSAGQPTKIPVKDFKKLGDIRLCYTGMRQNIYGTSGQDFTVVLVSTEYIFTSCIPAVEHRIYKPAFLFSYTVTGKVTSDYSLQIAKSNSKYLKAHIKMPVAWELEGKTNSVDETVKMWKLELHLCQFFYSDNPKRKTEAQPDLNEGRKLKFFSHWLHWLMVSKSQQLIRTNTANTICRTKVNIVNYQFITTFIRGSDLQNTPVIWKN